MLAALAIGACFYVLSQVDRPWLWTLLGSVALAVLAGTTAHWLRGLKQRISWLAQLLAWMRLAWLAPHVRYRQLGLTLAILASNLLAFYACARAVGVELSGTYALLVLPATLLVMALPVSIAGWGVREAAAAVLWPIAQVSGESAIAASIAYGLVATASALPGVLFLGHPLTVWLQHRHGKRHKLTRNQSGVEANDRSNPGTR
jgi:uncharacterized membrane protein YbhN (UPF0104 family)